VTAPDQLALGILFGDELDPGNADVLGITEVSLASAPVWQMGTRAPAREVVRRDERVLGFLASARNAPLGELEFDVLTWAITQWYRDGQPPDGRLTANFGDIAAALYGGRQGGKQYALVRRALDNLYNVSLDVTVLNRSSPRRGGDIPRYLLSLLGFRALRGVGVVST
jgi:hypothetical protein